MVLHLAAAEDVETQRKVLHQNWQQQLQRATYEVRRASRQYQLADPENRLVAARLFIHPFIRLILELILLNTLQTI